MKAASKPGHSLTGRRFSKRKVEITINENGEFHTEQLDIDDRWGTQAIEQRRQHARDVLEAEGIDVQALLEDAPHGGLVQDHVLWSIEREPDSRAGLAARIFYLCSQALACQAIEGGAARIPGIAYRLGRLVTLLKVYDIEKTGHSKGGHKAAIRLKREAATGDAKLKRLAKELLSTNDRLSRRDVASILAERGYGGAEAIRRKLSRLLPTNARKKVGRGT